MKKLFDKHKVVGVGLIAGLSCLAANPAEAALFNFSYTFDTDNPGVELPTSFVGMVEGDLVGDVLENANITMFDVIEDGSVVATIDDFTFTDTIFTESGEGVLILSDENSLPVVALEEGDAASYISEDFVFTSELFSTERWSLTAKSVPEGDMSMVSWLALAAIGGLSVKKGKSLLK
jgi:hypothetical protein